MRIKRHFALFPIHFPGKRIWLNFYYTVGWNSIVKEMMWGDPWVIESFHSTKNDALLKLYGCKLKVLFYHIR